MSDSFSVCTSDRFARRAEGKAVGFECVTMVLDEVSAAQQTLATLLGLCDGQERTFACSSTNLTSQNGVLFASATVE
jgi:hypothetical protein